MFSEHAPDFIAHRLAVFPTGGEDGKRPLVSSYHRMGLRASRRLAEQVRFRSSNLGFCAGPRSGLTVIDVDTPNENAFADALARFGETPIKVRSGSGHWQAWYRHNGEKRQIRAFTDTDILGGGVCIAPPSIRPDKGNGAYRFLEGCLDDLGALPAISTGAMVESTRRTDTPPALVEHGQRNNALLRQCLRDLAEGWPADELLSRAHAWNEAICAPPETDEWRIENTVKSAIRMHDRGENWIGREARAQITGRELDGLGGNGDAVLLLLKLRAAHGWRRGGQFTLARAMAGSLGWTLPRFKRARTFLCEQGHLRMVHPGGSGPGDPPRYILL